MERKERACLLRLGPRGGPQNRSCDIGQYPSCVVFGAGSAGSARGTRVPSLSLDRNPEEEREQPRDTRKQSPLAFGTAAPRRPRKRFWLSRPTPVAKETQSMWKGARQSRRDTEFSDLLFGSSMWKSHIFVLGDRTKTAKNQPEGFGG